MWIDYIVLTAVGLTLLLGAGVAFWLDRRGRRRSRLYDLKCERCGGQLDYRQSSGADHLYVTPCPCCCPER